jgi:hypothetical protein
MQIDQFFKMEVAHENRPAFEFQKGQIARENRPLSEKGGHPRN